MLDARGMIELLRLVFEHVESDKFDRLHGKEIRITFIEGRVLESPLGSVPSRLPQWTRILSGRIHSPHTWQSGCLVSLVVVSSEGRRLVPLSDLIARDASVEIELAGLTPPRLEEISDSHYLNSGDLLELMRIVLNPQRIKSLRGRRIHLELPEEREQTVFFGNFDSAQSIGLVSSIEGTIIDFYTFREIEVTNLVVQLQKEETKVLLHPRDLIESGARVAIGLKKVAAKTQG